jgi:hypothetical protein
VAARPAAAQGTTGAVVLNLPAGARAGALAGAYSALHDSDLLFYNPAGLAGVTGASASYTHHLAGISVASLAGAARVGPLHLGGGLAYLDGGSIRVVEPDPDYGGETGYETGDRTGAAETVVRLAVALPLAGGQFALGASGGLVAVTLAETQRTSPLADIGVQYRASAFTLAAGLRNLGSALAGDSLADSPLPTELRTGAALRIPVAPQWAGLVTADVVYPLESDEETRLLLGAEGGLLPVDGVRAVLRAGVVFGRSDAIGTVQFGGGLGYADLSLDYAWQTLADLGNVHRFGLRWAPR